MISVHLHSQSTLLMDTTTEPQNFSPHPILSTEKGKDGATCTQTREIQKLKELSITPTKIFTVTEANLEFKVLMAKLIMILMKLLHEDTVTITLLLEERIINMSTKRTIMKMSMTIKRTFLNQSLLLEIHFPNTLKRFEIHSILTTHLCLKAEQNQPQIENVHPKNLTKLLISSSTKQ